MKILSIVLLLAMAALSGCVSHEPAPSALSGNPTDVYVVAGENFDHPLRFSVGGNLVDVWPSEGREGMVAFEDTVAQIQQAKRDLNYLVQHKAELDPGLVLASGDLTRLQGILTDPESTRQLEGLWNYFEGRAPTVPAPAAPAPAAH